MDTLDFEHFKEWNRKQERMIHIRNMAVLKDDEKHLELIRHDSSMNQINDDEFMKQHYDMYLAHVSELESEKNRRHMSEFEKIETPVIRSQRPVVRRDIPIPGR